LSDVPSDNIAKTLVMPDGGENLEVFVNKAKVAPLDLARMGKVIASMDNLFEGLRVLHDAGLVHFDIKLPNIVMNSEFKTRFIDFGLTRSTDPINYRDPVYKANYFAWPFQVHYLSRSFQNGFYAPPNAAAEQGEYIRGHAWNHLREVNIWKPDARNDDMIYRKIPDASGKIQTYFPEGFVKNEIILFRSINADRKKLESNILISTDVYSLGRALAIFYSELTGHKPVGNPMRVEAINYPDLANFSLRWYTLTENMSHISQWKRWTLQEAHSYFKTMILPVLPQKFGASRKRTKRGKKKGGRTRRKRNFPRVG